MTGRDLLFARISIAINRLRCHLSSTFLLSLKFCFKVSVYQFDEEPQCLVTAWFNHRYYISMLG